MSIWGARRGKEIGKERMERECGEGIGGGIRKMVMGRKKSTVARE
jgi:hypothetical protein